MKEINARTDSKFTNGKHVMSFTSCDSHGRGEVSVIWNDKNRNAAKISVHPMVTHTLLTYAFAQGWKSPFLVHGYTSAYIPVESSKTPILFHANPYLYGGERFHFGLVRFSDDHNDQQHYCPCRIVSFVKFMTRGFPTPETEDNNPPSDDSAFAIVHAATKYVSLDDMEHSFIVPFCLGDVQACSYIVPIRSICDPVFVCPNYGKDGLNYLCCLPYRPVTITIETYCSSSSVVS